MPVVFRLQSDMFSFSEAIDIYTQVAFSMFWPSFETPSFSPQTMSLTSMPWRASQSHIEKVQELTWICKGFWTRTSPGRKLCFLKVCPDPSNRGALHVHVSPQKCPTCPCRPRQEHRLCFCAQKKARLRAYMPLEFFDPPTMSSSGAMPRWTPAGASTMPC